MSAASQYISCIIYFLIVLYYNTFCSYLRWQLLTFQCWMCVCACMCACVRALCVCVCVLCCVACVCYVCVYTCVCEHSMHFQGSKTMQCITPTNKVVGKEFVDWWERQACDWSSGVLWAYHIQEWSKKNVGLKLLKFCSWYSARNMIKCDTEQEAWSSKKCS